MRCIPPLAITEAMLTSSTAAEPGVGEVAWSSGSSYSIGDKVIVGAPSSTVTMTIASPCVVSWSGHGLPDGTPVVLTTTGDLPTGLTAGQIYYIVNRAASTFQLSEMLGGAPVVTTGSQSGTHTATAQVHRKYQSLIDSNSGNPPANDDGTKWADIGPTNRWAALDLLRNTGTSVASPLTIVLTPGERIDSWALVGMVADSFSVTMEVDSVEVYSYSEDLSTRIVLNAYDYCFLPFEYRETSAGFDLPPYSTGVLTITLTRATGNAVLGGVILGTKVELGEAVLGAESDADNYSDVERDRFGEAYLQPLRSVPRTNIRTRTEKSLIRRIYRMRAELNAKVAFWSAVEDTTHDYFEPFQTLGFYRGFRINADLPNHAELLLDLEEI